MHVPVLSAVDAALVFSACLSLSPKPVTRAAFSQRWRAYLGPDRLRAGEEALLASGALLLGAGQLALSAEGQRAVARRCGPFKTRAQLEATVLPALALGLDATGPAAQRLKSGPVLQALVLAARFGLAVDATTVTLPQVVRALLSLEAAGGVVRVDGGDAFNAADSTARLRSALIACALGLGDRAALRTGAEPVALPRLAANAGTPLPVFAARVRTLMLDMPLGTLSDSQPVADVFDAYAAAHPGELTLEAFKCRLLDAQRQGLIALRQLDRPEALPSQTRSRSEIEGRRNRFHLILRD
jgi:hypothetical protein